MDIIEKRITKRHLSESELSDVNYYNCIFERIQLDNFNFAIVSSKNVAS